MASPKPVDSGLNERVARDQRNAQLAAQLAKEELAKFRGPIRSGSGLHGASSHEEARFEYANKRLAALRAISANPFQVMVEVYTEVVGENGRLQEKEQLWYANEASSSNEVFNGGGGSVNVLAWTHPGVQLALVTDLGDCRDVKTSGLRLRSVETLAKARFDETMPAVSAVYQPGGAVRPRKAEPRKTGLKAVKLDMTRDQVQAFISRMSGMMIVTGAPGSGKTTVAFQRIRFLFDQQGEREAGDRLVAYTPELTRVFLANENLADQAKSLLMTQLDIPAFVVDAVGQFTDRYLEQVWLYKHGARPRQRKLPALQIAARTAVLGLSDHHDLGRLWEVYEKQVVDRLGDAKSADWLSIGATDKRMKTLASALTRAADASHIVRDPLKSSITMGAVYQQVSRAYEAVRDALSSSPRTRFDELFQQWLYWVYDPVPALATYFGSRESEGAHRIRRGTGARVNEAEILEQARSEWNDRVYGPEDRPWLAWLLRFALPEAADPRERFREMPSSIAPAVNSGKRWTHVAIDEAQDLCVAEASLLGSLVDPDGALTVSADFRQIVSPVHGMQSPDAFKIGRSLRGKKTEQIYPFARNMRQSRQIGRFLQGFYEVAFKERPTFDVNVPLEDKKPQLIIAPPQDHALRVKQIASVLGRSEVVRSIALLQINEDEQALVKLRTDLEKASVGLANIWAATGSGLLTTSVERIKGLEFDACIVLGLEDVETASLNFTLNRAYVALSRPARRLVLICSEYPAILRKVDKSLFDVIQS
ncbi:AAA family ATPase [Bradyrhizobium diversitatis]|uniref:DNA helicase n=1 Tax=Bradyrhizobium diversitatis TaxID=2755406 RepID=A0ABS0NXK7_9BRAD|nr:AAA family ATPase [Bradyrhizobium diversitatis]MBH5385739.1 hypothetical protein [Bradyrhizobium diversitatis]